MTHTLTKADLMMFTGTENWYRHNLARNNLYTDGVKYVAETGRAYWLVDKIIFLQVNKHIAQEAFQVWKLIVNLQEETAILKCEDGNGNTVYIETIEYTDFPLDHITFYLTDNVILLPSEY